MGESGPRWVERGVSRLVDYVGRSERHRVGLIIAVTLLMFLLAVVRSYFRGLVPLICTAVLVVYLYTRPSARATVTASATGPGLVFLTLFLYQVIGPFQGPVGGYEPLTSIILRNARLLLVGLPLLMLGAWLRRIT